LDVARTLYLDITGQTIPSAQVSEGRRWVVETNDIFSSLSQFRERQLTLAGWLRSLRGVQECAWLASDDLAPVAALPLQWFRKRFGQQIEPLPLVLPQRIPLLLETKNP